MKTWLAMLALCVPLAAHAVNKCKDSDGKVVFSDLPCPVDKASLRPAAQAPAIKAPEPQAKLPPLDDLPPTGVGFRPARLDFGRGTDARLAGVVSLLDSMALDGRNCEAALRTDDRKVAPCLPFATVMQPGREWSQALYEVHALLREPGLFERRRADFARASELIERISGHSQYMEQRLGTR